MQDDWAWSCEAPLPSLTSIPKTYQHKIAQLEGQFFLPGMPSKKRHERLNAFVVATPCCFVQGGMTRMILCLRKQCGGEN